MLERDSHYSPNPFTGNPSRLALRIILNFWTLPGDRKAILPLQVYLPVHKAMLFGKN